MVKVLPRFICASGLFQRWERIDLFAFLVLLFFFNTWSANKAYALHRWKEWKLISCTSILSVYWMDMMLLTCALCTPQLIAFQLPSFITEMKWYNIFMRFTNGNVCARARSYLIDNLYVCDHSKSCVICLQAFRIRSIWSLLIENKLWVLSWTSTE